MATGTCGICGESFTKRSIGRHLKSCRKNVVKEGVKAKSGPTVHIVVEDAHSSQYWLHLEASPDMTLGDLDGFLRDIWLECCGHLSEFEAPKPPRPKKIDLFDSRAIEQSMAAMMNIMENDTGGLDFDMPICDALPPKKKVRYTYDFGSSTKLTVKAVENYETGNGDRGITLLARNDAPEIPCGVCGKPATRVQTEYSWEPEGWLCDQCLKADDVGDEMTLPVVNSPRVGVCGYTGDD